MLADLPYCSNALEPYLSQTAVRLHHARHHRPAIARLGALLTEVPPTEPFCAQIIANMSGENSPRLRMIFENAVQAWNHAFYWRSMRPRGGGEPYGEIARRIDADLGGHDSFARNFLSSATRPPRADWQWLVFDGRALKVMSTSNVDTPIAHGLTPLVAIDLCSHAYLQDYRDRLADYVTDFLCYLANWDFANANLARGLGALQFGHEMSTRRNIARVSRRILPSNRSCSLAMSAPSRTDHPTGVERRGKLGGV